MKVPFPKNQYLKSATAVVDGLELEFGEKKRVALCLISINERYWPYAHQVIEDCKQQFLPHHNVDYFLWTDMPMEDTEEFQKHLSELPSTDGFDPIRNCWGRPVIEKAVDFLREEENINIIETEPVEWPMGTLMRFHMFLQEEEKLQDYDYVFYMDADMRVVDKISDDVLGEGLTCAPHPGYAISTKLIPPLEPNPDSTAFIPRLGHYIDEDDGNGGTKKRFIPFYAAGGFQGGVASEFIKAMKVMKANIDTDMEPKFDAEKKEYKDGYIAIWNDESHWNKLLWDYQKDGGNITFLDVSYIYPDSLIKEYYIPLWGKDYPPKIITLTKPFSLSKQGGDFVREQMGLPPAEGIDSCSDCGDKFIVKDHIILSVDHCTGVGKPHPLNMKKV